MMKRLSIIAIGVITVAALSCSKARRGTGRAYMPDMSYSRAYETYASTDKLKEAGVNYNALPVNGTVARGEMPFVYPYKNDSAGYAQSAGVKNPLNADSVDMKEAERIYLINCGICHGAKLDGNGPLWNGGNGPFPAAPKNFMDDAMKLMAEGTMFHSVTYGKNTMGSYASQLTSKQRWQVIAFIKKKQGVGAAAPAVPAGKTDTTANKGTTPAVAPKP